MKKVIRLTESDLTRIILRVINEDIEHVKNLYKSWANKKSGNPEKALGIMDDVLKYQKKLPKKDFAAYSSYEELFGDLEKVKDDEKSKDVTKLYEDKDLLVIAANTWEASCKYGAGTKLCTTARNNSSDWKRYNETGTEFFWIFKNKPQDDPNHKFSHHFKIEGRPDWCNAVNDCVPKLPENSYPKKHPKYKEIISKLESFHNQRDEIVNKRELSLRNRNVIGWLTANIGEILELLNFEKIYKFHYDKTIKNFRKNIRNYVDDMIFDKKSNSYSNNYNNYDHVYQTPDYKSILNEILDSFEDYFNFLPQNKYDHFMMNSGIILPMNHIISVNPELNELVLNTTTTPKNFVDKINSNNDYKNQVNEVISESLISYMTEIISTIAHDHIDL